MGLMRGQIGTWKRTKQRLLFVTTANPANQVRIITIRTQTAQAATHNTPKTAAGGGRRPGGEQGGEG